MNFYAVLAAATAAAIGVLSSPVAVAAQACTGGSLGVPLFSNSTTYFNTLGQGVDPATGAPFLTFLATITAANPFDVPVSVVAVSSAVSYKGAKCITIDASFADGAFPIAANSASLSPPLPSKLPVGTAPQCDADLISDLLAGPIKVDTSSTLTISVGGNRASFKYNQDGVQITPDFENTP
ncbi:hypothetical protein DFJ73DRAFT_961211 [Zopfochytrium polystomum]|nr:hypothetical protein DFJ73DRAFT_961211 [Zopfochytrium polystomum]